MHINDPKWWPPGSLMTYDSTWCHRPEDRFWAVGIVVANDGEHLKVIWSERCKHRIREYSLSNLNGTVIFRALCA